MTCAATVLSTPPPPPQAQTDLVLICVLVAFVVVDFAVFVVGKTFLRLSRMSVRPYGFQLVWISSVLFYAFGELLPRVTPMPCFLVDMFLMLIVPTMGAVQFARNSLLLVFTRLQAGILKRGINAKETEVLEPITAWWRFKVTLTAIFSLFRPDATVNKVEKFNRLAYLRELRFLTSGPGLASLVSVILLPGFILALIIPLSRPVDIAGCSGCVRDNTISIIMSVTGSFFISFGLVLAYRVRNLDDRFGFIQESRLSVLFLGISLIFYLLDAFLPDQDPNSSFSFSILTSAGFIVAHICLTWFQVHKGVNDDAAAAVQRGTRKTVYKTNKALHRPGSKHGSQSYDSDGAGTPSGASATALPGGIADDLKPFPHLFSILSHPELSAAFEQLLAKEFALESLEFLKDTHEWARDYFTMAPNLRLHRARRLVAVFVEASGPMSVNLPTNVSKAIKEAVKSEVPLELFFPARKEIGKLLESGPCARFVQTAEFRSIMADEALQSISHQRGAGIVTVSPTTP